MALSTEPIPLIGDDGLVWAGVNRYHWRIGPALFKKGAHSISNLKWTPVKIVHGNTSVPGGTKRVAKKRARSKRP